MAKVFAAIVVLIIAWAQVTFSDDDDDANPIRQVVSDGLRELETCVLQVIGKTHHALAFARFAHRYGKKYETSDEMKQRYLIFVQSLETITSHNNKQSYTLGLNEFADMTWEEFSKTKLGASQNCSTTKKGNHKLTHDILPLTQDWRKAGIVSPVKSQGACGSCWTFSTTGALEAAYAQAYGKSVNLSEQQLVDCAGDYNNFGCKGGLPSQAYEYIMYNGGLDSEEVYPYTGQDGLLCKYSQEKAVVQVVNVVNITQGDEDELKHAVGVVRPVSVAFQAVPSFILYTGGVFTSDVCGSGPMDVNHAVVVVGYGVENDVPYWLIKNSWGPEWGLNGYFKMEMGKNMCGIATCASYPVVV